MLDFLIPHDEPDAVEVLQDVLDAGQVLALKSLLSRYWRSIMPKGRCRTSACICQTQHSQADASESQQTPAVSHVTNTIPGEVAERRVMLGDCDQKCSASPQLSNFHSEALTALPFSAVATACQDFLKNEANTVCVCGSLLFEEAGLFPDRKPQIGS